MHVDDAFSRAQEEIAALKRQKPKTEIEARARSCELMRLNQILLDASKRVVDANAAKRLANGNGAAAAKPVVGEATSLSHEVITALARGLVPFLREQIAAAVTPMQERLDALEKRKGIAPLAARLAGIEERMMKYEGVWSEGKTYSRGSFVTHAGSLWFCEDTNISVRPGAGSSAWKLAVKKGHAEQ
jgi:hypothetical protein